MADGRLVGTISADGLRKFLRQVHLFPCVDSDRSVKSPVAEGDSAEDRKVCMDSHHLSQTVHFVLQTYLFGNDRTEEGKQWLTSILQKHQELRGVLS